MSFDTLGLSQPVIQALQQQGYTKPTPIQAQSIPMLLEGRDLLGIAQTGTGKTAAFMLPSIDNLRKSDNRVPFKSCRMLVLAPTRELAGQIAESAKDYGAFAGMKVSSVMGGTSVNKDRNKLNGGTDILVATPGRLLDLIDQKAFNLSGVEILVLDEADQMLDLGFIHALKQIVRLLPKERQTLLFSATMPKSIKQLAGQYLTDPAQVSVAPESTTAERVEQYVAFVNQAEKQALLTLTLEQGFSAKDMDRVLVFTRTKHGADRVVRKLGQSNIRANAIHGNKSQPQRQRALEDFRQGKVRVLVATDIAARGIDISGVSHVINFELPNVAEQYVHRIGRTARAGADGVAIAFCAPDERTYLRDIQRLTKVTLDTMELPENFSRSVQDINARKPDTSNDRRDEGDDGVNSRPSRSRKRKFKPRPTGDRGAQQGKPGAANKGRGGGGRGRDSAAGGGNGSGERSGHARSEGSGEKRGGRPQNRGGGSGHRGQQSRNRSGVNA